MDVLTEQVGSDAFDQKLQAWANTKAGQDAMRAVGMHREVLDMERRITSNGSKVGWSDGNTLRAVARIPEHVNGFLTQFFGAEVVAKKDFWKWFLRKYPQFRVTDGNL